SHCLVHSSYSFPFYFTAPPPIFINTLSLHDALPIFLINVLVLFLNVSILNRLANRAAEAVAQVIPNEPELALRLIQKSPFDFFEIEEHTSELQSPDHLVCRLLLEKKKLQKTIINNLH